MADLPVSGLELLVKNANQAVRDLNNFIKSEREQIKVSGGVAKASSNTSKVTSALSKDFSNLGKNILNQIPGIGKFSNLLGTIGTSGATAATGANAAAAGTAALGAGMTAALPVIGAVAVAIGVATAGMYAFWKIGTRGAQLQPTIDAFGNLASQFGNSNEILNRLRQQTKGTVSDMELMRIATFALSGASQELGQIFAQDLGKNLNDVGRLAQAMGRDPVEAQNRWIDALKKGERELLDELGIIVSANEANEKYAKSINKSASELTAYEKTAAFAREASLQLNDAVAKLPEQSGVLIALQKIPVAIQNLKDKIALLIQPIFEPIAKAVSGVITTIIEGFNTIIYFVAPIFKVIGAIITETFATAQAVVDMFFGGFADSAGTTTTYIIAAFQLAGQVIVEVIHMIGSGIRMALGFFQTAMKGISGALRQFFGITGDTVNLNINQLAFNLGKGGALIIGSFAAGILRGGTFVLQAVTQIAQIVADFLMGFSPPKKGVLSTIDTGGENVATAWVGGFLDGVSKSFGEVTQFVNDRLGIIATFSREQIEASLARLDLAIRPFKESLAIIKADMQAIAGFTDPALKILERQRQNLLKAFGRGDQGLDIEQLRNQDRQIQRIKELKELGQDRIDQAELELAIAESQQAQERTLLGIARDRLGKETGIADAAKKASDAAAKAGGGGGGGAGAGEAGAGAGLGLGGGEVPDLLSNEAIEAAKANIIKAISGVASSAGAGISEGLAESGFGGALAGFQGQTGALGTQMGRIAGADPATAIAEKFAGLKDKLSVPLEEVRTFFNDQFKAMFGEEGTITAYLTQFGDKILSIFTGDESPIMLARTALSEALMGMGEDFLWLRDQVSEKLTSVSEFISSVFINEDSIMMKAYEGVKSVLDSMLGEEGFMRLVNEGEGTLRGALATLMSVLGNGFIVPFWRAVQGVADTVRQGLSFLIDGLASVLSLIGVSIPEIPPIYVPVPQFAKGTLGASGAFIAGERGAELITARKNNPLSVFPSRATMALERIGAMMERPAAMPMYITPSASSNISETNTNYTNSNNRNVTQNFRYSPTKLERAQMRAGLY